MRPEEILEVMREIQRLDRLLTESTGIPALGLAAIAPADTPFGVGVVMEAMRRARSR